jgi:ABC-type lipoprotein release transport system permease subunit
MNRVKNLFNYSLNCIRRYRVRTFVVLICLGVCASIFSSVAFLKDGLTAEGELSLKYAPDITVQGISSGRQTFIATKYTSRILETPGVSAVTQRIWGYGNVGNTLLVLVGVDLENTTVNQATINTAINQSTAYPVESGSFLDPRSNNTIVMGKGVASLLGAEVGDVLSILSESNRQKQFTVVGIFSTESSIYNADIILMNIDAARDFFEVPAGSVTDLMVYVSNTDAANKASLVNFVARSLSELPNCRVITKDILAKAQETSYGDRSGFFSVVWYIVLISVAIIAFNQTIVVGHESKFEIGLLKALGFSTTDIIQVRLIEGLVLGTLAGAIGVTFGILYDTLLGAPVLRDFMLGWATLYPAFPVPILVSATSVLFTFAITIVPLLFATVIPSWLNATVDPDIAMRGARA